MNACPICKSDLYVYHTSNTKVTSCFKHASHLKLVHSYPVTKLLSYFIMINIDHDLFGSNEELYQISRTSIINTDDGKHIYTENKFIEPESETIESFIHIYDKLKKRMFFT